MSTTIEQTLPPDSRVFCLFCMENSAIVRISKARMPYLDCPECKTRVFWNSAKAVRGYFYWCPDAINSIRAQRGEPPVDNVERYATLRATYGDFAVDSLVSKRTRNIVKHSEEPT